MCLPVLPAGQIGACDGGLRHLVAVFNGGLIGIADSVDGVAGQNLDIRFVVVIDKGKESGHGALVAYHTPIHAH